MRNDSPSLPVLDQAQMAALLRRDRRPSFLEEPREFASLAIDRGGQDDGSSDVALTPGEQAVMAAHGVDV